MAARAERLATVFVREGLQPGDRVGVLLPNLPESIVTLFATWMTPCTSCSPNARSSSAPSSSVPCTNGTPSGTNVRRPVERSSSTTTGIPASRSAATTCAPM